MAEHFTGGTESTLKWCNVCQRDTVHPVSGHKAGRCGEHETPQLSKKQQRDRARREEESRNPRMF